MSWQLDKNVSGHLHTCIFLHLDNMKPNRKTTQTQEAASLWGCPGRFWFFPCSRMLIIFPFMILHRDGSRCPLKREHVKTAIEFWKDSLHTGKAGTHAQANMHARTHDVHCFPWWNGVQWAPGCCKITTKTCALLHLALVAYISTSCSFPVDAVKMIWPLWHIPFTPLNDSLDN